MSKIYILLMALFWTAAANAQTLTNKEKDEEKILQQCINVKQLEPLYANQAKLYVLQKETPFGNIHPAYKGRAVSFLDKDQLKTLHPDAYFIFWIFEVNETKARVMFAYNYNQNTSDIKDSKFSLFLEKQGDNWIIENIKASW